MLKSVPTFIQREHFRAQRVRTCLNRSRVRAESVDDEERKRNGIAKENRGFDIQVDIQFYIFEPTDKMFANY